MLGMQARTCSVVVSIQRDIENKLFEFQGKTNIAALIALKVDSRQENLKRDLKLEFYIAVHKQIKTSNGARDNKLNFY